MNTISDLVGLQPEDTELLRSAGKQVLPNRQELMEAFLGRLTSVPAMMELLENVCTRDDIALDDLVSHINTQQFAQWDRFFDGIDNAEFARCANEIGRAHEKCGVTTDIYVASAAIILENMLAYIMNGADAGKRPADLVPMMRAIVRMFFLDTSYTIDSYEVASSQTSINNAMISVFEDFDGQVGDQLDEIAQSATNLSTSAANAAQSVRTNADEAKQTSARMMELTELVGDMRQIVDGMSDFVDVIGDVSKKTRLLALNATIEAARAGESGRGFSVVAAEIKDLANQAAEAAEQISTESDNTSNMINDTMTAIASAGQQIENLSLVSISLSEDITQQYSATQAINNNLQDTMQNLQRMKARLAAM